MLYEGWKTRRRKALPEWGLEVFVKDVNQGRRGGEGLHPKASDKRKSPHTFVDPFLCGQPFIEKDGISYPKGGMKGIWRREERITKKVQRMTTKFKWPSSRRHIRKQKAYNTRYSRGVSHLSTDRALCCLTSEIGREPVRSAWYGRRHLFLQC